MEPDADTDKACVPVTWFGASATLVFEYGAFVAPFLAIPFDWCGLSISPVLVREVSSSS